MVVHSPRGWASCRRWTPCGPCPSRRNTYLSAPGTSEKSSDTPIPRSACKPPTPSRRSCPAGRGSRAAKYEEACVGGEEIYVSPGKKGGGIHGKGILLVLMLLLLLVLLFLLNGPIISQWKEKMIKRMFSFFTLECVCVCKRCHYSSICHHPQGRLHGGQNYTSTWWVKVSNTRYRVW